MFFLIVLIVIIIMARRRRLLRERNLQEEEEEEERVEEQEDGIPLLPQPLQSGAFLSGGKPARLPMRSKTERLRRLLTREKTTEGRINGSGDVESEEGQFVPGGTMGEDKRVAEGDVNGTEERAEGVLLDAESGRGGEGEGVRRDYVDQRSIHNFNTVAEGRGGEDGGRGGREGGGGGVGGADMLKCTYTHKLLPMPSCQDRIITEDQL